MIDKIVVNSLKSIVGDEFVSTDEPILVSYMSKGIMGLRCECPELVIRPKYTEEIRKILKIATQYKIPVTPLSGGLSGGFACPSISPGGILLDLSRMDRILEVDTDARYVVVEPGVKSAQIWRYFMENYPDWVPPIPDGAPPAATILGDALERGFCLVTSKYGPQADNVLGLEVVLPTGQVIKTGSWTVASVKPFYKWGPGPDFTGLFLGSQGTLGVVTKLAIKIFPNFPVKDIVALCFNTPEDLQNVTLEIIKKEVGVMVQGGNWWLVPGRKPIEEVPHTLEDWVKERYFVPPYMMNFEIWGDEKRVAREKEIIYTIVEKNKKLGVDVKEWKLPPPAKKARLTKPNKIAIPYAQHKAGFLFITWYLPWKGLAEFIRICENRMVKYGFSPIVWVAAIEHGREAIGMPIVCFDSRESKEIESVEDLNNELTEIFLDKGWINYRPDETIHAPLTFSRANEYLRLLKEFKKIFDPAGIMHPGRLCL
jgi:glycolate oxidase